MTTELDITIVNKLATGFKLGSPEQEASVLTTMTTTIDHILLKI